MKPYFPITYEADILFTDVYFADIKPEFGDMLKVMYWDIEVFSKTGEFPNPKEAKFPICGISFTDSYSDDYTTLFFRY